MRKCTKEKALQRKVVLTFALVLCLATSAQAALSIVNTDHLLYVRGTTVVQIPIRITGNDPVANVSINVEIAAFSFNAQQGEFPGPGNDSVLNPNNPVTPTISFLGNNSSGGSPLTTSATATGDYAGNFMATSGHFLVPGNGDDSYNSDNGEATNPAFNIPASTNGGLLITL